MRLTLLTRRRAERESADEIADALSCGVSELERETITLRLELERLRASGTVPAAVGGKE